MTESQAKTNGVNLSHLAIQKREIITLKGITTSQIRTREKLSDTPAYCFLKTDELETDIPIIFRIKENKSWIKPTIKKGSYLVAEGQWAINKQRSKGCLMRKSFTATSYQLLKEPTLSLKAQQISWETKHFSHE